STSAVPIALRNSWRISSSDARSMVDELRMFDRHFIARLRWVVMLVAESDTVTCLMATSNRRRLVSKWTNSMYWMHRAAVVMSITELLLSSSGLVVFSLCRNGASRCSLKYLSLIQIEASTNFSRYSFSELK